MCAAARRQRTWRYVRDEAPLQSFFDVVAIVGGTLPFVWRAAARWRRTWRYVAIVNCSCRLRLFLIVFRLPVLVCLLICAIVRPPLGLLDLRLRPQVFGMIGLDLSWIEVKSNINKS